MAVLQIKIAKASRHNEPFVQFYFSFNSYSRYITKQSYNQTEKEKINTIYS